MDFDQLFVKSVLLLHLIKTPTLYEEKELIIQTSMENLIDNKPRELSNNIIIQGQNMKSLIKHN